MKTFKQLVESLNGDTESLDEAYINQDEKKDIVKRIKPIMRKYKVKATYGIRHHSVFVVNIKSAPFDIIAEYLPKQDTSDRTYITITQYNKNGSAVGKTHKFLLELFNEINKTNHDNSDVMTDYFDVGFYVDVNVGKWDKPFVVECNDSGYFVPLTEQEQKQLDMLDEAKGRYEVIDGTVHITKANYKKVHSDFKAKYGKDYMMLAMNPENGRTEMMGVKFVNEALRSKGDSLSDNDLKKVKQAIKETESAIKRATRFSADLQDVEFVTSLKKHLAYLNKLVSTGVWLTKESINESYKQYLPNVPKDFNSLVAAVNEETQSNAHTEARWVLASYLKDKKLVRGYEAIMELQDFFHDMNDLYNARNRLDKALFYQAKQKFSKEEYAQLYRSF